MASITSTDARTGEFRDWSTAFTTEAELTLAVDRATSAARWLADQGRDGRANLLGLLAESLEKHSNELVLIADAETALGAERMRSELARTCFQLRFMAGVVLEGSYLNISIEHEKQTVLGSQPDLRRINVPIGPVAVFGSSNFPFAFSVPGGDSASALAAGCPVVVKAHGSHPHLSSTVGNLFSAVLKDCGAPEGVFQVVFGREAGVALVQHPGIRAVGFTGSLSGGRALYDLAAARIDPIPFFGELGSVNPLLITVEAVATRAAEIAAGLGSSMTIGAGQFCTKPGLFFVPTGAGGDDLVSQLVSSLEAVAPSPLLNDGISSAFRSGISGVLRERSIRVRFHGEDDGRKVAPVLVEVGALEFDGEVRRVLSEEYFGPFAAIVRWETLEQVERILRELPPALTGTIHSGGGLDPALPSVTALMIARSGRVIFDGYPTGVSVAWGMNHGGQYPASTTYSTSVGAGAIDRWVRPVSFQAAPPEMLPSELRDFMDVEVPRRVEGVAQTPAIPSNAHDSLRSPKHIQEGPET